MARTSEPTSVHVVRPLDHLFGIGPADGVGRADGRFVAGAQPVHVVAGLLPVRSFLKDRRALAHLEDIHHRVGDEQVLAAPDGAAGDVGDDLHDGLDLSGFLERRVVEGIAPGADHVGLLFTPDRFDRRGLGHQGGCGQVFLQAEPLDIGSARVGDHLDVLAVVVADEAVESLDQITAGLVVGPLGQVLEQRVQPLGGREGELILGDRRHGDAASGQCPEQVLQVEVRFFADGRGHVAGFAVELVDSDHLALGHVVGQRLAARVVILEG